MNLVFGESIRMLAVIIGSLDSVVEIVIVIDTMMAILTRSKSAIEFIIWTSGPSPCELSQLY